MAPLSPLVATLVLTFALASDALCVANCSKDDEQRAHNEYVVCQAQAQGKLRNGTLDICDYFDTSVNVCAEVLSRCQCDDNLRTIKENSLRVSIRALRIEGTFDFSNCSIVQEYNITDTADSQKIIEGKCNEKEFQDAYKSFFDCKTQSETDLRENIAGLEEKVQDSIDRYVCQHFEHTLNHCFQKVKQCSVSQDNWIETRRAFILSATKTNEAKKLGLNLHKCNLMAEDGNQAGSSQNETAEEEDDLTTTSSPNAE